MDKSIRIPPKEGDIYKVFIFDKHTFELKFGYYADFERESGEPVVIYPDLIKSRYYTNEGNRIVTAIQDPCEHYSVPEEKESYESCNDCIYYSDPENEMGICKCIHNKKRLNI